MSQRTSTTEFSAGLVETRLSVIGDKPITGAVVDTANSVVQGAVITLLIPAINAEWPAPFLGDKARPSVVRYGVRYSAHGIEVKVDATVTCNKTDVNDDHLLTSLVRAFHDLQGLPLLVREEQKKNTDAQVKIAEHIATGDDPEVRRLSPWSRRDPRTISALGEMSIRSAMQEDWHALLRQRLAWLGIDNREGFFGVGHEPHWLNNVNPFTDPASSYNKQWFDPSNKNVLRHTDDRYCGY